MDHYAGVDFTVLGSVMKQQSTPSNQLPNSPPLTPILCFHGSGFHTHYDTWLPLIKEISTFAPVVFYERHGTETSVTETRDSHSPKTRLESLGDLVGLLHHLAIRPPYVLLAHSYGGAFAREFLQKYPGQVAGMVLAETGQETPTKHDEEQYRKQLLGNKPLSVIHADSLRDKREETTTPVGREMLRQWTEDDERLKKAQLQLSSNARYIYVDSCGHNVVRERPDIVAEEVRWVLRSLTTEKQPTGLRGFGEYLGASLSRLRGRDRR